MPVIDTAVMVTQLIDMVVQGIAPKLRAKARKALLNRKRDILKKITASRFLTDKLENWYSRRSQVDADVLMRSAGFGGVYEKYLKSAADAQHQYDTAKSMLQLYEAKQVDRANKVETGLNRLENGSPFMANKIAAETLNKTKES